MTTWRTAAVGGALLLSLGCGGLFETPDAPDVVEVLNPDGTHVQIARGDDANLPDGFPVPPPDGLEPASVIHSPDGGTTTATYRVRDLDHAAALAQQYAAWFEAQGVQPEVQTSNLAGTKTTALVGDVGEFRVTVTLLESMGKRLCTLRVVLR